VARWAGIAILVNGVLDLVGVLLRGQFVDPSAAAASAFVSWASQPTYVPAYLVVILGSAIGTFGYIGLYPAIRGRLALTGAVLAAGGYQFLLALLGILVTFHAFAVSAATPQAAASGAAAAFSGGAGSVLEALSGLNFIGSIVLAAAIWRARWKPLWAGIPLAIAPFLLAFPVTLGSELVGCILLACAGLLILVAAPQPSSKRLPAFGSSTAS
jgi:hypothetical protein